jgi:GAF domain-containing protein
MNPSAMPSSYIYPGVADHITVSAIDFAAVLKISQALSGIICKDKLLHEFSQVMLKNSGGDRCALILTDQSNQSTVAAVSTIESIELCSEPLDDSIDVPVKLIEHVQKTNEILVFNNLEIDRSVIDTYLQRYQPKSLVCLPILNQEKSVGILYLENRHTDNAFTDDRIFILNSLCTQAAISLDNAAE